MNIEYKLDTKKKRFAFEILLLILSVFICSIIFFTGKYRLNKVSEKEQSIKLQIDSLNDNVFRNRYLNLKNNQELRDYTYESYKKDILNDKDTSFRIRIYYDLCRVFSEYRNEKTLELFLNEYQNVSIDEIEEQVLDLEIQNDSLSKQYSDISSNNLTLIIILLIIFYPLRFLYYLIKWSFNIIKGNEINKETTQQDNLDIKNNDFIFKNKIPEKNSETEEKLINHGIPEEHNNIDEEKSKFKNYFTFNNEYLNGVSYFNRMLLGLLTSWILGLGFFLMIPTIYKRSKSLGLKKKTCVLYCFFIPIAFILNFIIGRTTNLFGYYDESFLLSIQIILSIPHLILLFKNGTRKKVGKFQVRY